MHQYVDTSCTTQLTPMSTPHRLDCCIPRTIDTHALLSTPLSAQHHHYTPLAVCCRNLKEVYGPDPAPPARLILWAHNSHLGDARATDMSWRRNELNVGQLMKEEYGNEAYNIGFTTHSGTWRISCRPNLHLGNPTGFPYMPGVAAILLYIMTLYAIMLEKAMLAVIMKVCCCVTAGTVTASDDWGDPARRKRVRPGMPGSYEQLMHGLTPLHFALDMNDPELQKPLEVRGLGLSSSFVCGLGLSGFVCGCRAY